MHACTYIIMQYIYALAIIVTVFTQLCKCNECTISLHDVSQLSMQSGLCLVYTGLDSLTLSVYIHKDLLVMFIQQTVLHITVLKVIVRV